MEFRQIAIMCTRTGLTRVSFSNITSIISILDSVKLTNKFICSQGPMEACATSSGTVDDFWRMIWQEKVKFIVMLCNVVEDGKVKCAQYFPVNSDESKLYGSVTVANKKNITTSSEKSFESLLLEVSVEGSLPSQLTLMRWNDWPDFSVPQSGMGMIRILKAIHDQPKATALIHCSAGIGRFVFP